MKNLLIFLVSLLTLTDVFGQEGTQYLIFNLNGQTARGKVRRNEALYPLTTEGFARLKADVESTTRPLSVSVLNTNGTLNRILPALSTPAPSWIAGFRYSYAAPLLTFDGTSGVGTLKFVRLDGTSFTTTNPDGVPITSGQEYGPGPTGETPFSKRWQLNYTGTPLVVTTKQADASATYSYTLSPVNGANRVVLTGGTSTTTTPVTTTTVIAYTKLLFIGNSIMFHGPAPQLGWTNSNGMAASAPEKDFVHLLTARMQTLNPNITTRLQAGTGFELQFGQSGYAMDEFDEPMNQFQPDLILLRIGENISDSEVNGPRNMTAQLNTLLDKLTTLNAGRPLKIIATTGVWSTPNWNAVVTGVCTSRGIPVIDLTSVNSAQYFASQYADAGVAHHPNDAGMQRITDLVWAGVPKSTTTTTPPTTTTAAAGTMTSAQLYALGLNGAFTAPADQGWNIQTTREKYIESTDLKIGFLRGGAVISYGARKNAGPNANRNLINSNQVSYNDNPGDFRYNTTTDDVGRQIMFFSDYMTPSSTDQDGQGLILKNGKKTGIGYKGFQFNTGGNGVQGGSLYPALDLSPILSSAIYTHPQRGTEFYAKMRPMIWGVNGEPGWVVGEQWVWFATPNTIGYFARHTVEARDPARFDEQRKFYSLSQENPCIYCIAPLTQKLIDLPGESRKNIYNGNADSPKYYTSTARIGAYEGQGGIGVTYYSPMNSLVGAFTTFAGTGAAIGEWNQDPTSYIQGAPNRNFDNPGVYEDFGYITFGTEAEANAAIASLPAIDQTFDFDFTKENMLWENGNSRLIKESAGWTLYLDPHTDNNVTSYLAKIMSPARAWPASSLQTIHFEIAVTNTTTLQLEWQKPGLNYQNQFRKEFTVHNDGQFYVYDVSTTHGDFNGIISSLGFSAGSTTQPNAKVVIRRIWKN